MTAPAGPAPARHRPRHGLRPHHHHRHRCRCAVALVVIALHGTVEAATRPLPSWAAGYSPLADFQSEIDSNLTGGAAPGCTGTVYFQGGFTWDSDRAGWWRGGQFVATYLAVGTQQPDRYVGDIQGISGLTAPYSLARVYKLYYQQDIAAFTVRGGLMNANDYFDDAGVAANLFNASYGTVPTWSQNLEGSSTYPFSSLGVMVTGGQGQTTLRGGIFGADAQHPWQQPDNRGSLSLVEMDRNGRLGGGRYTIKTGVFHNQQNPDLAAALGPSTTGFYDIGEYRWTPARTHWGTFLVISGAPAATNPVPWYVGGGLTLTGYRPAAPHDSLSIGFSRATLRGLPHAETSGEFAARFALVPGITLQPGIQVVMHPRGHLPTALAASLRLTVNLVRLAGD